MPLTRSRQSHDHLTNRYASLPASKMARRRHDIFARLLINLMEPEA
jgi:hypothetical protein